MVEANQENRAPTETATASNAVQIKKTWPLFLMSGVTPYQVPGLWILINLVVVSTIMWPGEPYHPQEIGILYGAMYIVGAFSKLILGRLADKHARHKVIAMNILWFSSCFFFFGFVPAGLGPVSFIIFLVIGLVRELVTAEGPAINSFIDDTIPENKRSTFFGIYSMSGSVFYMLAMFICGAVFKSVWRQYFWLFGIVGIICAILVWFKTEEPKRGAQKEELKSILRLDNMVYKHDLTRETLKSTIFSPTNVLMMVEGIFTQITAAIPTFLLVGYLQSPPFNISPLVSAMFVLFFGVPGMMVGSTIFAKKSDELASKSIKNRLYLIFWSLMATSVCSILAFIVPFDHLDPASGDNLIAVLSHPIYWMGAILHFAMQFFGSIHGTNQRPLLQKINLPEAQAAVTGINAFLEILAIGIGTIIAGTVTVLFGGNYLLVVIILVLLTVPGKLMWLLCTRWIDKDVGRVSNILKTRATEMAEKK
jgi:MFS family permease